MTKKDYELIARAIHDQWHAQVLETGKGELSAAIHKTAMRVAAYLASEDQRFKTTRFLSLCGIECEHDFTGVVHYPSGDVIVCKVCGEAQD